MNDYTIPYLIRRLLEKEQANLTPIEDCARRLWLSGNEGRAVKVLAQLESLKHEIGELTSILVGHGIEV